MELYSWNICSNVHVYRHMSQDVMGDHMCCPIHLYELPFLGTCNSLHVVSFLGSALFFIPSDGVGLVRPGEAGLTANWPGRYTFSFALFVMLSDGICLVRSGKASLTANRLGRHTFSLPSTWCLMPGVREMMRFQKDFLRRTWCNIRSAPMCDETAHGGASYFPTWIGAISEMHQCAMRLHIGKRVISLPGLVQH